MNWFLFYVLQAGAALSSVRFWTKNQCLKVICMEQAVDLDPNVYLTVAFMCIGMYETQIYSIFT